MPTLEREACQPTRVRAGLTPSTQSHPPFEKAGNTGSLVSPLPRSVELTAAACGIPSGEALPRKARGPDGRPKKVGQASSPGEAPMMYAPEDHGPRTES